VDGIEIDFSDEQWRNADCSIRESFDPSSNVRTSRPVQSEKQRSHRTSTVDGIQIDFSVANSEKASISIRTRDDGASKVTFTMNSTDGKSSRDFRSRTWSEAEIEQ
jgi:hypothetical protein